MKLNGWNVREIGIRDFFATSTISASEWLSRSYGEWGPDSNLTKDNAWTEFLKAFEAVSVSPGFEWPLREEPRVAYDPIDDTHYFIFKIHNNGMTFLVSRRVMSEVPGGLYGSSGN